jgi:hypothetical protein
VLMLDRNLVEEVEIIPNNPAGSLPCRGVGCACTASTLAAHWAVSLGINGNIRQGSLLTSCTTTRETDLKGVTISSMN